MSQKGHYLRGKIKGYQINERWIKQKNNGRACCRVFLRQKVYSYLTDDSDENKKAKGTKMCVIRQKLKFENYKHCLEATQLENKINQLGKNELDAGS